MKSNFLSLFDTLTLDEAINFKNFLGNMHKRRKVTIKILNFYYTKKKERDIYPSIEDAAQEIFSSANPKRNQQKLRNGLSDLNLLLKDFLIYEKIKKTNFEKDLIMITILEERGLGHQQDLLVKNMVKNLNQSSNDIWTPFWKMLIEHYLFFRNTSQKTTPDITYIQNGIENLDDFYFAMKLKYASELKNRKHFLPISYEAKLLPSIIHHIKSKDKLSLPIQSYLLIYQFLETNTFLSYKKLKEFFFNQGERLKQEEQITIMIYLLNFIAGEIRKGKNELNEEAFLLYDYAIKGKLLIYEDFFDASQFINMINVACYLEKFNWAKKVINSQIQYLKKDTQEQYKSIALATVLFGEKKFETIPNMFISIKFQDVILELLSKLHILASLYELGAIDDLANDCDTFIRFIKRNKKLGKNHKEASAKFAKLLKQLINQKVSKNVLEKELEKKQNLYFRTWLSNKVKVYKQIKATH